MKAALAKGYLYARREPFTVAMTALGIATAGFLFWQNEQTAERVTVLERSPCQINPSSAECQKVKIDSDRGRSVKSACVITNKAGLGCPALEGQRQRREGVDDGGGQKPSGQPGPPSGGSPGTSPGTSEPPESSQRPAVDVTAPVPVGICLGPLAVNCD